MTLFANVQRRPNKRLAWNVSPPRHESPEEKIETARRRSRDIREIAVHSIAPVFVVPAQCL